jgi:Ran GTPase-activating protein (RanGAP) involved in mRNA processing and transport
LEFLNLRDDNLKASGVLTLTKTLADTVFNRLRVLDISGNDLNAKSLARLAQWIPVAAPNLEELLLDDNEFGSEGAASIVSLVKALPSLKKLSLSVCELGGNGGLAIAKALQSKDSSFAVNLDGNFFRDSALEKILELLDDKDVTGR